MRRVIGSAVLIIALLMLTVQVTLGAGPIHDKFAVDDTFPEELCGIEVTTHLKGHVNVLIFDDHLVDLSRFRITSTNGDGDWLSNSVSGPVFVEEQLVGDILTITERHAGVQSHLRSADGQEAAFDRGTITFEITIDLNDPESDEDDVFLGVEIISMAGPHPEADSDFTLFCEVVEEVLG